MYKSNIVFIILCFFCLHCSKSQQKFHTIDIEPIVNKMYDINLGNLTDSIYYIKIKLPDSLLLRSVQKIVYSEDFIFITDLENCFLLDRHGNFLKKIGAKGRGPKEYKYVNQIGITQDGVLLIQSMYDLIKYQSDGSYLETISGYFQRGKDFIGSWKVINDTMICGKIAFCTGMEKDKALIIDLNGKIISEIKNNYFITRSYPVLNDFEINAIQTIYQGKFFFKDGYNDTLYLLQNLNRFSPELVIKTGKYSKSLFTGKRDEFDDYLEQESEKITLENIFIIDQMYLLDFQFNKNFPTKRLSPRYLAPGVLSLYNTSHILGVYRVLSQEIKFCLPYSTDNPLSTSGLHNDFDGGPFFFPSFQIDDSTLVMPISVSDLKSHLSSVEFLKGTIQFPEQKKRLTDFINTLSAGDGYVLMNVIFKTKNGSIK